MEEYTEVHVQSKIQPSPASFISIEQPSHVQLSNLRNPISLSIRNINNPLHPDRRLEIHLSRMPRTTVMIPSKSGLQIEDWLYKPETEGPWRCLSWVLVSVWSSMVAS